MARELKVYGWQGHRSACPPAPNGGKQTREVVAATSQREAARCAGYDGPWQMFNLREGALMPKTKTAANPADLTLRNLRAEKRRNAALLKRISALELRVAVLEHARAHEQTLTRRVGPRKRVVR